MQVESLKKFLIVIIVVVVESKFLERTNFVKMVIEEQRQTNQNKHQKQQQKMMQNQNQNKQLFNPSERFKQTAHISSFEDYKRLYDQSIKDPTKFWLQIALKEFYWKVAPTEKNFLNFNFNPTGVIFIEWMKGAKTNMCYNAVDRIIDNEGRGDKIAYIWEANSPGQDKRITYNELRAEISKFANVLKSKGVKKGSRVAIYMPVTIELVIAMLGCARIGAVHTVVFAGFSAEALAERMVDAKCMVLVTADGYYRGNKLIQLKEIAAEALEKSARRLVLNFNLSLFQFFISF